ncbi:hypothetical protein GCM10010916_26260 [Paenibacillus abyssi]|uniref:Uncharacterized protein n=1 Tax=Paenibacillus abyssi TaxID=1340531 RepID=A0A917D2H3_9BACL|nr:hypothetical protein GCM10010916_26260 [Paenibacillus abyssi]
MYGVDESVKVRMPAKNTNDVLADKIAYCQKLITFIKTKSGIAQVQDYGTAESPEGDGGG